MLEQLNDWAPLLTILVSLGGLQLGLYLGLRADMRSQNDSLRADMRSQSDELRALGVGLAEVRERLASLETRVGHIETHLAAAVAE